MSKKKLRNFLNKAVPKQKEERPKPLSIWGEAARVNSTVVLRRMIPSTMTVHHIKYNYINIEKSVAQGIKPDPCPLCGATLVDDRRASLAFTSQGNSIFCLSCSDVLIKAGISHVIQEEETAKDSF